MNAWGVLGKFTKAAAVALALGIATASHGAVINSTFVPGNNTLRDDDAERVLRLNPTSQQYEVVSKGNFQVGDILQAILAFTVVNTQSIPVAVNSLQYQLTAFSELKIDSINTVAIGGGLFRNDLTFVSSGRLAGGVDSMVDIYEKTDGFVFNQNGDPDTTGIPSTVAGNRILSLGVDTANNPLDFWVASVISTATTGALDLIQTASVNTPQAASGQFGISVLDNPGGVPILPLGRKDCTAVDGFTPAAYDVCGNVSGFARKDGVNSGWLFSSNTNVRFAVPEPGALGLLGVALAASGFASMRRKASKK
ncbi:MAG: PEP-CTERM sorting domain-containing protein [Burkholderiales bacterium]|nr:PEP-CTERM sorting domain-containing protein [Burkholderiales bacterium]